MPPVLLLLVSPSVHECLELSVGDFVHVHPERGGTDWLWRRGADRGGDTMPAERLGLDAM